MKEKNDIIEKTDYWDNIKWMWRNLVDFDKKGIIFYFMKVPARILMPVVTGLVVKLMIDAITTGVSEMELFMLIAGITFAMGSLTWIEPRLNEKGWAIMDNLNMKQKLLSFDKLMSLDFERLESTDARKKYEKSKMFVSDRWPSGKYFLWDWVSFIMNAIGGVAYLFIVGYINPILVTVMVGFGVIMLISLNTLIKLHKKNDKNFEELQLKNTYFFRTAVDFTKGKDVRLYSFDRLFNRIMDTLRARFTTVFRTYRQNDMKFVLLRAGFSVAVEALAFYFLIREVVAGNRSVSDFLFYFGIATGFWGWLAGFVWGLNDMKIAAVRAGYFREFIDLDDGKAEGTALPGTIREIRFEDVSFTYPVKEHPALDRISFTVAEGEKIAIVGENGAGKTTLVKLLTGLYKPSKGRITLQCSMPNGRPGTAAPASGETNNISAGTPAPLIKRGSDDSQASGGIDIADIGKESLANQFSVVFQDHVILPMSVRTNICCSKECDEGKLAWVIEQAGLTEKIENLPHKADTAMVKKLNENAVDFSGGEMQKLLLARALYKDAPILVLDEPTAALDPIAENNMYLKYNELTQGKISFFISHRLSSTRFCDRIFFMAEGRVVEIGTHEELLEKGGAYARMYSLQSFYYREGNNYNREVSQDE